MVSSDVEICNLALGHLGVDNDIVDLDSDRTPEARACRKFFDTVRDQALADYDWGFARKRVHLSVLEEAPNDDWNYSYSIPSDCLHARRIVSGVRNEARDVTVKFIEGKVGTDRVIFTDEESAELVYTARVDEVEQYPSDFKMALSLRLAAVIAPQVTGGDPFKLGIQALQKYRIEIGMSSANAANRENPDSPPDAEWIRGR